MELTDKQIKDLVARRHPEYEKKKEHWDFLASVTSKRAIRSSKSAWNALIASTTLVKW
ncbi:Uncharacterised protein [Salmonella enterica subsp. enterica serovar Typhi]|nr:Uncharacterised protein [Salmonella enterica subsp. enterica serovar Typhi]